MKKEIFDRIPILNVEYQVWVYRCKREIANKDIKEYLGIQQDVIEAQNRGKTIFRKGFHPCIWIDPKLKGKDFYATLAHEGIHAVLHIMDYIGMSPLDISGDEFLAHSVASIIRFHK